MTKYEFLIMDLPILGRYRDPYKVGSQSFPDLETALETLGQEGWMIGSSRIDNAGGHYQMIMQRPIQE